MNLSPKSLQCLIDLKAELLSRGVVPVEAPAVEAPKEKPKREEKPYTIMRGARQRGMGYQHYKQRGDW